MQLLEKIARIEAWCGTVGICTDTLDAPQRTFVHSAARPFLTAHNIIEIKLFGALATLEAIARGEVTFGAKEMAPSNNSRNLVATLFRTWYTRAH